MILCTSLRAAGEAIQASTGSATARLLRSFLPRNDGKKKGRITYALFFNIDNVLLYTVLQQEPQYNQPVPKKVS